MATELRFALLATSCSDDVWPKVAPNFALAQRLHPTGWIPIGTGLWMVDRHQAETHLWKIVDQLRRLQAPTVVAPLALPPSIAASDVVLSSLADAGTDFFPMPFDEQQAIDIRIER